MQLSSTALLFGVPDHRLIRFKRIDFAHSCWVVMNKVHSGSNSDFQHFAMRQGEEALTDFLDRFWIAQNTYEMGIDMLPIEKHTSCRLSQGSAVTALSCLISSQRIAQNRDVNLCYRLQQSCWNVLILVSDIDSLDG